MNFNVKGEFSSELANISRVMDSASKQCLIWGKIGDKAILTVVEFLLFTKATRSVAVPLTGKPYAKYHADNMYTHYKA